MLNVYVSSAKWILNVIGLEYFKTSVIKCRFAQQEATSRCPYQGCHE